MTKQQILNALLADLAGMTNQATSKDTAVSMGKSHYLYIEYSSAYGGYRIVNVGVSNGSHAGAFGGNGCEPRLPFKQMELKLRSLIAGAEYAMRNTMQQA